ncbi:RidA family protein [Pseudolabrys taiwanensis]|uniref:RidA family protein n=1 Tax=Pseudolabrys taiwanensis TaxID=331696 RepID=A0A346A1U9_9HYPH|nr:RidA family protein [Pseudolabrys taiwanensis]AXK83146.1 RidA family protein [Pseudolabrys taiwanensis]
MTESKIDARLRELGIELPSPPPPRTARILMAKIAGGSLYVSGQLPSWNGELRYVGKVGREFTLAEAQAAARLSALNVIAQARGALGGDLDRIAEVTYLRGYVNVTPDFIEIAQSVNGASDLMIEVFGAAGAHARTAIGVAMMPYNAAIEVEAQFLLK